ncbi:MAG: hypothetical protein WDO56_31985 [Gammaproteobacteria bacterium]
MPLRTPEQFGQLQFHCGKPPPAADPSTRIFIAGSRSLPPGAGHAWSLRVQAPSYDQRFATYMVISMPNRKSMATGVSHFMVQILY